MIIKCAVALVLSCNMFLFHFIHFVYSDFSQVLFSVFLYCKVNRDWKTSFEKNCFSAWASTLNMGLINKR